MVHTKKAANCDWALITRCANPLEGQSPRQVQGQRTTLRCIREKKAQEPRKQVDHYQNLANLQVKTAKMVQLVWHDAPCW